MPRFLVAVALTAVLFQTAPAAASDLPVQTLNLPTGFHIEVFARVPGARSLAYTEGAVFVGSRGSTVHAIRLSDRSVHRVQEGLNVPNGIAVFEGYLYVAEQHRLVRYRLGNAPASLASNEPEILFDGFPNKRWHGWRYAAFDPYGVLYVSIGAPCNICRASGFEGTILRFGHGGFQEPEIFARGIRNSVGFDWHPTSGELHFTDNGADRMGDDSPPDELNRADRPGVHFGYPYFGGGHDRTPDFRDETPPADVRFPEIAFGAHVAALGIDFYSGGAFPEAYRLGAFVAQHGSWNRSVPDGYRVVYVGFDAEGRANGYTTFLDGWLDRDGEAWGRPVDLEELPDGSLLISDDHAGAVYRVTFSPY